MNLQNISKNWISTFLSPLIIAGPCSAESEQQMCSTAEKIKENTPEVNIFRAGIWKPRTKPNGFEGVGIIGLPWLKKVKEDFGMKITTEVANAEHVKAALDHGVDILWIGARTTANPFAVQEIADALKEKDIPVLIKNPVNPDLALWLGAFERLLGAGITKLGAIHRGFSTYHKTKFRNEPNWQLAIDFMNVQPNIPFLIDPSHIMGKREGIADITQQAFSLGYDGMMIETHIRPAEAWSDANQQVTPSELKEIITGIHPPCQKHETLDKEIERHRIGISEIDEQIIRLLKDRMKFSEKIAKVKQAKNAQVFQPERWKEIMNNVMILANENQLSEGFVQKIFKSIHEESIEIQHRFIAQNK